MRATAWVLAASASASGTELSWWQSALVIVAAFGPVATFAGVVWAIVSYNRTNTANAVQAAARVICRTEGESLVIENLSDEAITSVSVTQQTNVPAMPRDFVEKGSKLAVPIDPNQTVTVSFWGPHGWWWRAKPGEGRPVRIRKRDVRPRMFGRA